MLKLALVILNFLFLPNHHARCFAFKSPATTSTGKVVRLRYCYLPSSSSPSGLCSTTTRPTLNRIRAHHRDDDNEGQQQHDISGDVLIVPTTDDTAVVVSRRSILSACTNSAARAATLTLLTTTISPNPSFASSTATNTNTATTATTTLGSAAQSTARIVSYPSISSLEPLYEFKLSIDAIVTGTSDPSNWPFIRKRLENFFGGFIINEKNYFMGVGISYMNEMVYDKGELPNYVVLDKETRFEALENTMNNLESLKSVLGDNINGGGGNGGNGNVSVNADIVDDVKELAKSSQRSLQVFFDMIPSEDVKAVEELFANVQKADANGDGKLSEDEIVNLSPMEREIWKRRVDKF